MELHVDKNRAIDAQWKNATGMYVRAEIDGRWGAHDIAVLTKESLLEWLRSRGGHNRWAEGIVASLLGHPEEAELDPVLPPSEEQEVYRTTFEELTPDAQTELVLRHLRDLLDVPAEAPLSQVAWTLFQWLQRSPS